MLELKQHGTIHEIRLARPPANALNTELLEKLRDAVLAAPGKGAEALVLSSETGFFSGGLDVPFLMKLDRPGLAKAWSTFFAASRALAKSPVPVVAAIAGHAPAGGCVLALCCDYRVMARGPFKIGLNETQVGLAVPDAIQHLMRRVVGTYRAERLIVAGAMLDCESAERIGLVDELADADHAPVRAIHWLQELLKLPRQPLLATRAIARADLVAALDGFNDTDLDGFLAQWDSEHTQAALKALVARLGK